MTEHAVWSRTQESSGDGAERPSDLGGARGMGDVTQTITIAKPPTVAPVPTAAPAPAAVAPVMPPPVPGEVVGGTQLVATDVSAWFGKRKVLERVSMTMVPGRVTALIGPSGCGKSTFLRTLNRMHEVVPKAGIAGRVELDGVDIYGPQLSPTQVRLRIGMVFQKPNPFPTMSIGGNVLAGLKLSGTSTPDRKLLVEESLRRAGLWDEVKDRLNERGGTLSGGQQQRLCIARALAVRPQVLLMDEPCSALDPISTRVVEQTITELANQVTIVIVTHNMQQAMRVSHDCGFFLVDRFGDPGRLVESGLTTDLFGDPRDPRTADYVHGRFG
jgi:phosphate transport system ATP-binding protein